MRKTVLKAKIFKVASLSGSNGGFVIAKSTKDKVKKVYSYPSLAYPYEN